MLNFPIDESRSGDMWEQYSLNKKIHGLVQYAYGY